jgi:uncharacterized delta-60 repeat protein
MRSSLLFVASLTGSVVLAQVGSVDPSFDPIDLSGGTANGLNGSCRTIAMQPDGKVLVAGDFSIVNGVERVRVARMNFDGSLDLDFDPGYGANAGVRALAVQADGKVLVGGLFTYFNGLYCNHIVRLNADGSLDEDFSAGNGLDGNVLALAVQPDGHILVGGDFYHINNVIGRGLVRLNPDGSQDTSFDAGDIPLVYSLTLRPDGRVIVGGTFSFVGGVDRKGIAALHADGSLDQSFAPLGWNSSAVFALALQADGKVVVGGLIPGGIARLELNGEVDPTYGSGVTGFGGWDPRVYALALQPDGRVLAAGGFSSYNGAACNGMARLTSEGMLDASFFIGEGFNGDVFAMALQADGKPLVGGFFDSVDGTSRSRIARLESEELSTAIASLSDLSLEVYPNPSQGQVFVRTDARSLSSLSIAGPDGRTVRAAFIPANAGTQSIDLSAYAKGIYLVRIAEGATVRTERVVIQ